MANKSVKDVSFRVSTKHAQRLEELETRVAHLSHDLGNSRRAQEYWYEHNRILENRVRKAAAMIGNNSRALEELAKIGRTVPIEPRKKWGWRSRPSLHPRGQRRR